MRLANHDGRAVIVVTDDKAIDVERASDGVFGPDVSSLYGRWAEFTAWAATVDDAAPDVVLDPDLLGAPSPRPAQVVAIGLNYEEHAHETGFAVPTELPPVFTKFPSSITGPRGVVDLPPGGHTDWEVEVVVVVGRAAHRIAPEEAWGHVAGLTVGQDLSERVSQFAGPAPQFGLAKSFPGFSPMGPWLVTLDEVPDPDDLALGCSINGDVVQDGRTSNLIFSIPRSISALSQVITLLPGDVLFTGTPDGVGVGRSPQRFLQPGETLRTWVDGLGEMVHTFR